MSRNLKSFSEDRFVRTTAPEKSRNRIVTAETKPVKRRLRIGEWSCSGKTVLQREISPGKNTEEQRRTIEIHEAISPWRDSQGILCTSSTLIPSDPISLSSSLNAWRLDVSYDMQHSDS
ncbi:hypothetical protein YC2023_120003 [Brassica napus]